ncbi:MAG TPA: mechanosensitive ion channel family protein [Desulfarculaceae bacterium]|nr:mechanosensitive ion channel family protein [Desulfarculaceae bacterium]
MKVYRFLVMTITIVLALSLSPPVQADDLAVGKAVKEQSSENVGAEVNSLLKQINLIVVEGKRLNSTMKTVTNEERLVKKLQLAMLWRRSEKTVLLLADNLLKLEKKKPQPELRLQVESIFRQALTGAQSEIEYFDKRIDIVREQRRAAPPDKRYALQLRVDRLVGHLDAFLVMNFHLLEKMTQIGMDPKSETTHLQQQLTARVEELFGRISLSLVRVDDLEVELKDIPGDAEATKLLIVARKSLDNNSESMTKALHLLDKMKVNTADYRSRLVSTTQNFSSSLFNVGVVTRLLSKASKAMFDGVVDRGPAVFMKIFLFGLILYFFIFMTRLLRSGLEKVFDKSDMKFTRLAREMFITWISRLVMIFGFVLALSQVGISLGPLLAGLGVAGFVVGFALQDTLSNFASGMMILIYRPYDIGDLVDVGGVFGIVNRMNLVSTTLLTLDNQMIVIPNSKIWGDVIKNVTAQKTRRVDMVFGISYSDDIPKAEALFEEILKAHDKILKDPEPIIRLHELGASSVDFVVRPWVLVADYWDVYWDVTRAVKLKCDAEGISIPFPQRDVHIYNENALVVPAAEQ